MQAITDLGERRGARIGEGIGSLKMGNGDWELENLKITYGARGSMRREYFLSLYGGGNSRKLTSLDDLESQNDVVDVHL
ncbi:hypothetical protein J5N97_022503 [Dioscorea zingiberensis]|uniref:Uncharacterized protein n=1 Tax=Dioscorea zingiberensis TaxID=325984 RepID=A0A9D5CAP6_9LILI|nr:hypothetical protein J5N97_022503 [Dioscorea zingiberensis]